MGPSHIINIKKEKRETDEETKQILRMLEKDDVGTSRLGGGGAGGMGPLYGSGKGLWSQDWRKNCSLMSWKPGEQRTLQLEELGLKWAAIPVRVSPGQAMAAADSSLAVHR